MAFYALTSLKETIALEFLRSTSRVSLADEIAPKSLLQNLSSMQAFLSEKFQGGDGPLIRDLEIKIRDFALKVEDDIEIQLSNILQITTEPKYQDGEAREKLHQTLREAVEDAEKLLKIINDTSNEAEWANDTHSSIHLLGGSSRRVPQLEEIMPVEQHPRFIGCIKDLLLPTNRELTVCTIYGMMGIGKTTFAGRVYGDPLVASNFDIKAWVTVSHDYNLQQILCDLLQSMMPSVIINEGSTLFHLKEQIYKLLKDKKYFIVLDDVWSTQAYEDIRQCFPNDKCGSWILLTTQFADLAKSTSHYWYEARLLEKDESWDLFCRKISVNEYMAPRFEEIAKYVVKQCSGLPRSIVAVAECLSKCNYTLREWKKVKKEIEALGTLYRDTQYSSKLTLVYNQLTRNSKVCFLYFAIFPKDTSIQVKKLIRLWIAEGFVEPLGHVALEDRAYMCLDELAQRSLVLTPDYTLDMKIKTCWMHDALHSFCVREAQKEGIFCAVNTRQCLGWSLNELANSFRWLSLRSHKLDYYVFFGTNNPRSLFFFNGDSQLFVPFKLLRTLDLSTSLSLKGVPLHLGGLVFLRYLSLPQWFEGLDDVVASNQNLQTLYIPSVKAKRGALALHLSSRVWDLPQLRHLQLGNMYMVDPPSMDKEHLQTLSLASPTHFRKEVYSRFPNLKTLKIFYKHVFELSGTRGSCSNPIIILESVNYLSRLETLKVIVPIGSITLLERPMFPAQLKKLSLSGTNLPIKVLKVIGRLPILESLKLENAFCGRVWEVNEEGFPKLRGLFLESRNLERWVADACHFPKLELLFLRRCYCLKEIPHDFVKISELKLIELEQCRPSLLTSAKWIQANHETYFNIFADGMFYRKSYSDDES